MLDLTAKRTMFSLEVFPPKDTVGVQAIYASMGRFRAVEPDYISVTYGAGGDGGLGTIEIASDIKNKFGIESIAHLTCVNSTRADVDGALDRLAAQGIDSVLALRGDVKGERRATDFTYCTDLIAYLNKRGGFQISAACYPEGHLESGSYRQDIEVLKRKADLGVSHFISQLFFDNADFYRMLDEMHAANIDVPVQAGIMPITNSKQILRIIGLCGAKLPPKLAKILGRFEGDREALAAAGVNYALEQITDLIASDVSGIHLYSMNNPTVAERVASAVRPMLGRTGA